MYDNVVFTILTPEGKYFNAFRAIDCEIKHFLSVFLQTEEYFILAGIGVDADINKQSAIEDAISNFVDGRRIDYSSLCGIDNIHFQYSTLADRLTQEPLMLSLPEYEEISPEKINVNTYRLYLGTLNKDLSPFAQAVLAGIICGMQGKPELSASLTIQQIMTIADVWPIHEDRVAMALDAAAIVYAMGYSLADARDNEPTDCPRPR